MGLAGILEIIDPFDPGMCFAQKENIVSKGTYRLAEIKFVFKQCYLRLSKVLEGTPSPRSDGFLLNPQT